MNKKIVICILIVIIVLGIIVGIILNNKKTNDISNEINNEELFTEVNQMLYNEEAFNKKTDDAVERAKQILNNQ